MISFLRHSRTGKNCAHFEIQKLLKFWDTLIDMRVVSRPPPLRFPVQTVPHLNLLTALPTYEARAAVEGVK
jgi:hypothetical protein